ncbi:hypothetical protein B0H12DRAFT_1286187 [Mycena haematopus]|nr:hypothetical protein B0H12DRAFT_1286187 [Mycena haematopus]
MVAAVRSAEGLLFGVRQGYIGRECGWCREWLGRQGETTRDNRFARGCALMQIVRQNEVGRGKSRRSQQDHGVLCERRDETTDNEGDDQKELAIINQVEENLQPCNRSDLASDTSRVCNKQEGGVAVRFAKERRTMLSEEGFGALDEGEFFWRDRCGWLKDSGYLLRPRYQEGWTPPWKRPWDAILHEEYQSWAHPAVMDATVIADGSFVVMKRIQLRAPSQELDLAVWLSAEPQRSDPTNHCVPILRVLSDPKEPGWAIIVMPLLREYDKPRFDTVGEVIEFFKQIFEVMTLSSGDSIYAQAQYCASTRDCSFPNILMDGASLYRVPFHPITQNRKRDYSGKVHPSLTRTQHPVKYYIMDFGLSRRYKPEERPPLEPTVKGGDKTAPEMALDACDPFPTDVYYLGNSIQRDFLEDYDVDSRKLGFEFMRPLVKDMIHTDPSQRPSMDEVVERFTSLLGGFLQFLSLNKLHALYDWFTTFGYWFISSRIVECKLDESLTTTLKCGAPKGNETSGRQITGKKEIRRHTIVWARLSRAAGSSRCHAQTAEDNGNTFDGNLQPKVFELMLLDLEWELMDDIGGAIWDVQSLMRRLRILNDWLRSATQEESKVGAKTKIGRDWHTLLSNINSVETSESTTMTWGELALFNVPNIHTYGPTNFSASRSSWKMLSAADFGVLHEGELFRYSRRDWLKDSGYLLRPRYQDGWAPPWKQPIDALGHEEFQSWAHPDVMDATVIADGSFVVMKYLELRAPSEELDIATWFSAEPQRSDPTNHCVPILRVLSDPKEPGWAIIVMPLLREYDKPRFDTVGEVVEFFKQIFEVMTLSSGDSIYAQAQYCASTRDCSFPNILMDGASLYRVPFHPITQNRKRDYSGKVHPSLTRTQNPVKYYITDFGLSRRYKPEERPPLEPTTRGGDKTAPEMVLDACDPFPTDVYYLGNSIQHDFLEDYDVDSRKLGFEFMRPLVKDMIQTDPSQRPSMDEVVQRFNGIVHGLSSWKLRSRVVKRTDISLFGFYYNIPHWFRRISFIVRRVPPIPVPSQ